MMLSLIASLYVIVLAWRHRDVPGAIALLVLAISTYIWAFGFFIESHSFTLERQLFFTSIGYIGSLTVPVAWFIFALHYTTGARLITGWKAVTLCIIPFVSLVLVWTNNLHHLMWYDEHLVTSGTFLITVKTYGPFFWVALTYDYLLTLSGIVILVRRLFTGTPLYRGQAISLLIAVILPLLWNAIYIFDLLSLPRKDLTPVMFAASGIAIAVGVMRFHLLKAVPFAREFIIQHMYDGILVFNMQKLLLEANPVALAILGADKSIIGNEIKQLARDYPLLGNISFVETSIELTWEASGETRIFEVDTEIMRDSKGNQMGWLTVLHDVTERNQKEMEYRTVIQTTADGFCLTDIEGRFLDVNDAFCRMIGYSRDELLKMSIKDIDEAEERQEMTTRIKRIKEAGVDHFETRQRCKNGDIIDVEINLNHIEIDGGRIFAFMRDITGRKHVEAEKRRNSERLLNAMDQTIEAIAMTVEMRDPYTAGHQRRVTQLACAIATYLHYSEDKIRGLRLASLIHDIGKVRIPTEILTNPEELSEAEFALMKTHAQTGYEILKNIVSPWPIARIIHQHHERLDGSGYPQGLSGDNIIPEARILAVADVVEAIASHRPYRPALGIDKALEEIVKNKGILYDPVIVDACVELFNEKDFHFE